MNYQTRDIYAGDRIDYMNARRDSKPHKYVAKDNAARIAQAERDTWEQAMSEVMAIMTDFRQWAANLPPADPSQAAEMEF
jgi:hypothetical protein